MSAKAFILFLVVLVCVSAGVYYVSYDIGSQDGYNIGYEEGNRHGVSVGHQDGFETGFIEGLKEGIVEGFEDGYSNGTIDGKVVGYHEGYEEGYSTGNSSGFDDGYYDGYLTGYNEGNVTGYDIGYVVGLDDGAVRGYKVRDPSYIEMLRFIKDDKTNKFEYIEDEFECRHFAAIINQNAFEKGYQCFYVNIRFPEGAHAIIAFNTTDRGFVYIEPQTDDIMTPKIGHVYWDRTIFKAPDYDDRIMEILIIN